MIDVGLLNYVVNDPDVLKWVAPGFYEFDCSTFDVPGGHMVGDAEGVVLFCPIRLSDGIYEMHYLFPEETRGKHAADRIREAVAEMFTEQGATVICGAVPREHRASRVMSRAIGARPHGPHTDSFGRACIVYVLERKTWAILSAV